jgi:hypothetical protein
VATYCFVPNFGKVKFSVVPSGSIVKIGYAVFNKMLLNTAVRYRRKNSSGGSLAKRATANTPGKHVTVSQRYFDAIGAER